MLNGCYTVWEGKFEQLLVKWLELYSTHTLFWISTKKHILEHLLYHFILQSHLPDSLLLYSSELDVVVAVFDYLIHWTWLAGYHICLYIYTHGFYVSSYDDMVMSALVYMISCFWLWIMIFLLKSKKRELIWLVIMYATEKRGSGGECGSFERRCLLPNAWGEHNTHLLSFNNNNNDTAFLSFFFLLLQSTVMTCRT